MSMFSMWKNPNVQESQVTFRSQQQDPTKHPALYSGPTTAQQWGGALSDSLWRCGSVSPGSAAAGRRSQTLLCLWGSMSVCHPRPPVCPHESVGLPLWVMAIAAFRFDLTGAINLVKSKPLPPLSSTRIHEWRVEQHVGATLKSFNLINSFSIIHINAQSGLVITPLL